MDEPARLGDADLFEGRPDSEYTLCPPRVLRGLLHFNVHGVDLYESDSDTVSETMRAVGCLWRIRLRFGASISMHLEPMGTNAPCGLQVRFRIRSRTTGSRSEVTEAAETRHHRKGHVYGVVALISRSSLLEEYGPTVTFQAHLTRRIADGGTLANSARISLLPLAEDLGRLYQVRRPLDRVDDMTLPPSVQTKLHSDLKMVVGDATFEVHRCILAVRCPVFAAMLSVDCEENRAGMVEVVDCTAQGFDCFLRFLYGGRLQREDMTHVDELLFLSDKYDVASLKNACDVYLASRPLTDDTACRAFQQAERFDCAHLRKVASDYLLCNLNRSDALAREVSDLDDGLKQTLLSGAEKWYGTLYPDVACAISRGGHLQRIRESICTAREKASDAPEVRRCLQNAADDLMRAYVGLCQVGDV